MSAASNSVALDRATIEKIVREIVLSRNRARRFVARNAESGRQHLGPALPFDG